MGSELFDHRDGRHERQSKVNFTSSAVALPGEATGGRQTDEIHSVHHTNYVRQNHPVQGSNCLIPQALPHAEREAVASPRRLQPTAPQNLRKHVPRPERQPETRDRRSLRSEANYTNSAILESVSEVHKFTTTCRGAVANIQDNLSLQINRSRICKSLLKRKITRSRRWQ